MLLFFFSLLCESTEFLHYDDGPLLNCKEIGDETVLVSPKPSRKDCFSEHLTISFRVMSTWIWGSLRV